MDNRVVSTESLSANLGNPRVRIVAAALHPRGFSIGQIPGAVRLDCTQLCDATRGDFLDAQAFAQLLSSLGIRRRDSIVVYGDHDNSAAALAMWLFTMFGHTDVSLLDGGRAAWVGDDRETEFAAPDWAPSAYPTIARTDTTHRISRTELFDLLGSATILDTRAELEFGGEVEVSDDLRRPGHIPSAINVPSAALRDAAGRFLDRDSLKAKLATVRRDQPVIVYDRSAAQAAEMWVVLRFLLGWNEVRVYDGGWNEWGNSFGLPAAQGRQS